MAHAYTPGLKVAAGATIRNERRLPIEGEVTVQVGDKIEAEDVVAKASLPGNVQLVNIANLLSIPTEDIRDYMLKSEGEPIEKRRKLWAKPRACLDCLSPKHAPRLMGPSKASLR